MEVIILKIVKCMFIVLIMTLAPYLFMVLESNKWKRSLYCNNQVRISGIYKGCILFCIVVLSIALIGVLGIILICGGFATLLEWMFSPGMKIPTGSGAMLVMGYFGLELIPIMYGVMVVILAIMMVIYGLWFRKCALVCMRYDSSKCIKCTIIFGIWNITVIIASIIEVIIAVVRNI